MNKLKEVIKKVFTHPAGISDKEVFDINEQLNKSSTISSSSSNVFQAHFLFQKIPKDVWLVNVFSFLSHSEFKMLRLTCKWFRCEMIRFPFWKQQVPIDMWEEYKTNCLALGFPFHMFKIYVSEKRLLQKLKPSWFQLNSLASLQDLDLSNEPVSKHLKDEHLFNLPPSLTRLNIGKCTKLTSLALQYLPLSLLELNLSGVISINDNALSLLPRSLTSLNLNFNPLITDKGIKLLTTTIRELHLHTCVNVTTECFEFLSANCEVNYYYMDFPLHPLTIASDTGDLGLLRNLVTTRRDMDVNFGRSQDGITPLVLASARGHRKIVSALLNYGADVNLSTSDGTTPIYVAAETNQIKIVEIFIEKRADINKSNLLGLTPLYISSQNGHLEIVQLLLKSGASVNKSYEENGATPLYIASQNGHRAVVEALLEYQSNINAICTENYEFLVQDNKDKVFPTQLYPFTPLYIAWWKNQTEIISILAPKSDLFLNLSLAQKNGHSLAISFFQNLNESTIN